MMGNILGWEVSRNKMVLEFGHFAEIFNKGLLPLLGGTLEEGVAAPYKQMSRYLGQGAAGRAAQARQRAASSVVSLIICIALSDLPGRADVKVARHLLDRRIRPSSKEGIADSRFASGTKRQETCELRDVNNTSSLKNAMTARDPAIRHLGRS
jgi:hypothetical protein